MQTMIKVYVCSPLTGDIMQNIENARKYSRYIVLLGKIPITPHIYFTQFLDDTKIEERKLGMRMGLELLDDCDLMYVFGKKISDGMQKEIDYWTNTKKHGITYIKRFDLKKLQPK